MKKLALLALTAITLFGANDKEVTDFINSIIKKNPNLTPKSVKIIGRETLPKYDNWDAVKVLLEYSANDPKKGKIDVKQADMFFTKGDLITPELMDSKTDKNLKDILKPKVTPSYYNDEHFVGGNKNSKNKIVIFSDPLCPVCKDVVPDIIKAIAKNPTKAALWHYSYPLNVIHPASTTLVKAELALSKRVPLKDLLEKFYSIDVNADEKDEDKLLAEIAKQLKLKVSKEEINSKENLSKFDKELTSAYNILVRGTPSIYLNGEFDMNRVETTKILKELEK